MPETKCSLYDRLDAGVARRGPYGYTATHDALQLASRCLADSRPTAKKAVLVITDGKSNIGPPPIRVASELRGMSWNASWDVDTLGPQVIIMRIGKEVVWVSSQKGHSQNGRFKNGRELTNHRI